MLTQAGFSVYDLVHVPGILWKLLFQWLLLVPVSVDMGTGLVYVIFGISYCGQITIYTVPRDAH